MLNRITLVWALLATTSLARPQAYPTSLISPQPALTATPTETTPGKGIIPRASAWAPWDTSTNPNLGPTPDPLPAGEPPTPDDAWSYLCKTTVNPYTHTRLTMSPYS